MKVELLDSNNKVIEGFSKDECKVFKGDNVKAKIEWTGNASLASLKNKQLKVKFYIDNGEIFAFGFLLLRMGRVWDIPLAEVPG